jgi:hypothetical protein
MLFARTAPVGANITVDILKDSVEQSRIATLTAGSNAETTDITNIDFENTDNFGLKVKSIGSTTKGEDLEIVIIYQ